MYHEYNIIYFVIIFEMSLQNEEDISVINSCCQFANKFHFGFVFALNSSIIVMWIKLNASRYILQYKLHNAIMHLRIYIHNAIDNISFLQL